MVYNESSIHHPPIVEKQEEEVMVGSSVVEDDLDINDDGIVDEKDFSLAGKVLSSKTKKPKKSIIKKLLRMK